ncbi:MAG: hypothetical protein FWH05_02700, partial [Oscillospiraceae bacterium]|nr:hypothetical protein [Oscillospiraceae bacterium]
MINNKIYYVNATEATEIVSQVKENESLFLMELHGKEIQSWEDYVNKLDAYINFPTSCLSNISGVARYHDW